LLSDIPCLPAYYPIVMRLSNPIASAGKSPAGHLLPYLLHLCQSQLSRATSLPAGGAPLAISIGMIDRMRTQKQMARIYATRIVARVADQQPRRNRTII